MRQLWRLLNRSYRARRGVLAIACRARQPPRLRSWSWRATRGRQASARRAQRPRRLCSRSCRSRRGRASRVLRPRRLRSRSCRPRRGRRAAAYPARRARSLRLWSALMGQTSQSPTRQMHVNPSALSMRERRARRPSAATAPIRVVTEPTPEPGRIVKFYFIFKGHLLREQTHAKFRL